MTIWIRMSILLFTICLNITGASLSTDLALTWHVYRAISRVGDTSMTRLFIIVYLFFWDPGWLSNAVAHSKTDYCFNLTCIPISVFFFLSSYQFAPSDHYNIQVIQSWQTDWRHGLFDVLTPSVLLLKIKFIPPAYNWQDLIRVVAVTLKLRKLCTDD